MSRSRPVLLLLVALLVSAVAAGPAGASAETGATAPTASAAAKKKCKKGTRAVKVRSKGRTRTVCRKRKSRAKRTPAPAPKGPAGPSVAEIESIIRGQAQANHQTWLGPESIEVIFERPTQVLPMVMYDPYAGDPLHAGGPIEAWPVRAWVKIIDHKDATPEDDTKYAGCLGHLNSWWPYDDLHMFYRDQTGAWAYRTSGAKPGDCG